MQSLNSEVDRITERIIVRSEDLRASYLEKIDEAIQKGRARSRLSCGNLAHAMATCNAGDKQLMAEEKVANLAIVTSYNDMLSAHHPYETYPNLIKAIAARSGVTAQVAGGVPAMCDGVTQGQAGMELSLFSRDLIAMATAVSLSHNAFDGTLCLGVCDKIVPGLLIGALSFGHLPTVFLPAGPMTTGQGNSEKARVRQLYAEGKVGRKALLASESTSYHGAGTCTFYGTANSNQMLMEIMGLHLPGSSFVPPNTELRDHLTAEATEILIKQLNGDKEPISLAEIIDTKAIVNGIVGLMATGGSTNHAIHLVAIARAAGIIIDWQDMAELSSAVPLLCRIYPNGDADINHFHAAGGMGYLMSQLAQAEFLHQDVNTILGRGLEHYFAEPALENNRFSVIMKTGSGSNVSEQLPATFKEKQLAWKRVTDDSLDNSVLRPTTNPFSKTGGLKLLTGNLGRAVIKVSAVKKEHQIIEAPAVVFDSQNEFQQSFERGELEKDLVAVIRFQGPKTNGMPELHKLTPLLGVLQDKGFKVAIVTDGRMSGASGKVPAAIHLVPEASDGGLIAKVKNGDLIRVDAKQGIVELLVAPAELANREAKIFTSEENTFGTGREMFKMFRRNVAGAEQGASIL